MFPTGNDKPRKKVITMNITRTIETYKATAVKLSFKDGQPHADVIGTAEFHGTHATKAEARKALKEAGFEMPRGTEVTIEVVASEVYGCSFEDFMAIAKPMPREKAEQE